MDMLFIHYFCLFIYNAYINLCYMIYNFWNPTCNMHHWCSQNPTSMYWFCQYHPGPLGFSTDRWDGGTFWTFFVWHVHSSGCLVSDGSESGFLAWVACLLGEYLNDIPRKAFYWSGFSKLLSLFCTFDFVSFFLVWMKPRFIRNPLGVVCRVGSHKVGEQHAWLQDKKVVPSQWFCWFIP